MFLRTLARRTNFTARIKDAEELMRLRQVVTAETRTLNAPFTCSDGTEIRDGCRVITEWPAASSSSSTCSGKEDKAPSAATAEEEGGAPKAEGKEELDTSFPFEVTFLSRLGVQSEKLEELKNKVAQEQRELLYSMAEFQNLQRKQTSELEARRKASMKKFTTNIVPCVDTLNGEVIKASEAFCTGNAEHACVEGLALTSNNAMKSLGKFEIRTLEPQPGDPFVSGKHEEIQTVSPPNADDVNTIKDIKEKGWILNTEVIRKAMVEVYRSEEPKAAPNACQTSM